MFRGSFVAIVTPFKGGKIDFKKFSELIKMHIEKGTGGIVPCGTTGESATMSHDEHMEVVEFVVKTVNKKIPVIAGTGSNNTLEALRLTEHAQKVGADAALVITPYYNKPPQEGLYRHYKEIASKVDIPIVIYNVPGRTGISIAPETVARIRKEFKNVVAVKEASGVLDNVSSIIELCDPDFDVLSGDDALTLPMMAIGAKGVISVAANIVPGDMAAMIEAFAKGNLKEARRLHLKMFPLIKALFMETNPIPVKTALGILGLCPPEVRLPLSPMSDANIKKLKGVMKEYGLM
ncbi:MAG: 4-hydroxy-tetrahydrodipicolinate synthase [bacterium]